jgi:hypothetical protein
MSRPRGFAALLTPGNAIALVLLLASLIGVLWLQHRFDVDVFSRDGLIEVVDELGWYGPLVYMTVVALAVVVSQLPGVPLAIAASLNLGALSAFVDAYVGFRHHVEAHVGPNPSWVARKALDNAWNLEEHLLALITDHEAYSAHNLSVMERTAARLQGVIEQLDRNLPPEILDE